MILPEMSARLGLRQGPGHVAIWKICVQRSITMRAKVFTADWFASRFPQKDQVVTDGSVATKRQRCYGRAGDTAKSRLGTADLSRIKKLRRANTRFVTSHALF